VTLRVTAIGTLPKPSFSWREDGSADATGAVIDTLPVIFEEGTSETRFYDRGKLDPGHRFDGPAVILQPDCTTVVHPGQSVKVDGMGNLVVTT
jgi:N-methylhydantoinase A